MKLFQYSVIHLYSGRERRLSSVNQCHLKICKHLKFKSRTATVVRVEIHSGNVKIQEIIFSSRTEIHPIGTWMFDVSWMNRIGHRGNEDLALQFWHPRSPDRASCNFFMWGFVKDVVYVPPLPTNLNVLRNHITAAVNSVTQEIRHQDWNEFNYRLDHGRARVAHCVTGRWCNVSHYCRPLHLIYVFWAQRSTARCADSTRCTQTVRSSPLIK